jgi:hypothetical protein
LVALIKLSSLFVLGGHFSRPGLAVKRAKADISRGASGLPPVIDRRSPGAILAQRVKQGEARAYFPQSVSARINSERVTGLTVKIETPRGQAPCKSNN